MIVAVAICATGGAAEADLSYTFSNGGELEGDGTGSTGDNTADFGNDSVTGNNGVLTTSATVGGTLNENGSRLGFGSSSPEFAAGESWTFSWNIDTLLKEIDFDFLTGSETFLIQSDDWINAGFTHSDTAPVSFDDGSGILTFSDDGSTDEFDLGSLIIGDLNLTVSAGTSYVFPQVSGLPTSALLPSRMRHPLQFLSHRPWASC